MKKHKMIEVPTVASIICDKCRVERFSGQLEFGEFVSVSTRGGYGSIFEDGAIIEIDLCQRCFKELLGPFVRVTSLHNSGSSSITSNCVDAYILWG